jgi:hypothetical protein
MSERGPGRRSGSKTTPSDRPRDIWLWVQIWRLVERLRTGKTPSASQACEAIVRAGGLHWYIGGRWDALAQANHKGKRWLQLGSTTTGNQTSTENDDGHPLFTINRIQNAGSLLARFSEADKLVQASPFVRLAWMNHGRAMKGRPPKTPLWANPWHPKRWRMSKTGTFKHLRSTAAN